MLYREDPAGLIVIGQPAHAWVSGQLARAWGNEQLGTVAPWEEVCLAADQHDLAHARWEQAPKLNPQTGRPYSFQDMPTPMRLALVSSASAILISLPSDKSIQGHAHVYNNFSHKISFFFLTL